MRHNVDLPIACIVKLLCFLLLYSILLLCAPLLLTPTRPFDLCNLWQEVRHIALCIDFRHNISDARNALYDAANEWTTAVKKRGRFLGGEQPNLADVTVYGVLSSIEGCQAFKDLRDHTEIGKWYDDIKNSIENRMGKVQAVHA